MDINEKLKRVHHCFDLDETEKAYELMGESTHWSHYTYDWFNQLSEDEQEKNLDIAWDCDRYYSDFKDWWYSLTNDARMNIFMSVKGFKNEEEMVKYVNAIVKDELEKKSQSIMDNVRNAAIKNQIEELKKLSDTNFDVREQTLDEKTTNMIFVINIMKMLQGGFDVEVYMKDKKDPLVIIGNYIDLTTVNRTQTKQGFVFDIMNKNGIPMYSILETQIISLAPRRRYNYKP